MRPALPQTALTVIQRSGYGTARPVSMAVMPMGEAGKLDARHCVHDGGIIARPERFCQEYCPSQSAWVLFIYAVAPSHKSRPRHR